MLAIGYAPSGVQAVLQARLHAITPHIIQPDGSISLPVGVERGEAQPKLPAGDGCFINVPTAAADRAPPAVVKYFDAAASSAVLVRQAQRCACWDVPCAQNTRTKRAPGGPRSGG